MARPFERLKGLNIAALIEEAVKTLNPGQGLTPDEMVRFICSKLGLEEANILEKVDEFLLAGAQSGALLKTDGDNYVLNDNNKFERLTLDTNRRRRMVRRRRARGSNRRKAVRRTSRKRKK